jgi:hypothetical protein
MLSVKKQSTNLIIHFLCILFFFLFLYMIINMYTNKTMSCGCASGCAGRNVSCPCYRNRVLASTNEYYTPKENTSFTQYLDQVRQNQLSFSKEGYRKGAVINVKPKQNNLASNLDLIRKRGIKNLM